MLQECVVVRIHFSILNLTRKQLLLLLVSAYPLSVPSAAPMTMGNRIVALLVAHGTITVEQDVVIRGPKGWTSATANVRVHVL